MERNSIVDWYFNVPLITRSYLTGITVVAFFCQLEIIGPLQLYFNYRIVFERGEWWRLVTPFLYFGPVNFDFVFHMFFLYIYLDQERLLKLMTHRMRYCRVLEEESFRDKPADFLFMLLFGASFMLVLGPLLKAAFLSTALTFMIVYVWSRRNPEVLMNFLGVFNFTAPFMPWVLLGFSLLLSGSLPTADIIGIAVGHLYYYLKDMYPVLYGRDLLPTPTFLATLLNPREEADGLAQAAEEYPARVSRNQYEDMGHISNDEIGIDAPLMPKAAEASSSTAYRRGKGSGSDDASDTAESSIKDFHDTLSHDEDGE